MTEAQFSSLIKKNIECHWCRVENMVSAGMPDANAASNGIERWIELKIVKGNYLLFEWSQINWFASRKKQGMNNVRVMARDNDAILLINANDIERDDLYKKAHKAGLKIDDNLVFKKYYKPWDWKQISEDLFY